MNSYVSSLILFDFTFLIYVNHNLRQDIEWGIFGCRQIEGMAEKLGAIPANLGLLPGNVTEIMYMHRHGYFRRAPAAPLLDNVPAASKPLYLVPAALL